MEHSPGGRPSVSKYKRGQCCSPGAEDNAGGPGLGHLRPSPTHGWGLMVHRSKDVPHRIWGSRSISLAGKRTLLVESRKPAAHFSGAVCLECRN